MSILSMKYIIYNTILTLNTPIICYVWIDSSNTLNRLFTSQERRGIFYNYYRVALYNILIIWLNVYVNKLIASLL